MLRDVAVALRPSVTRLEDVYHNPSRRAEKRLQTHKNENKEVVEQAT
jgi:hypothetical protein